MFQLNQTRRQNREMDRREQLRLLTTSSSKWLDAPIQEFVTWMSGKPYIDQEPLLRSNPVWELLIGLLWLFGGGAASFAILAAYRGFWLLLSVSWLFTVGGARNLVLGVEHYAMHGAFSKNRLVSFLVGTFVAVVTFTQDYPSYKGDHIDDHHPPLKLATLEHDPDKQFIVNDLGFVPGQPKEFYWKRLRSILFGRLAFKFHLMFLYRRLKSNFLTAPLYYRVTAIAWNIAVLSLVAVTDSWLSFSISWVLPLTVGYHISALLQFLTEHLWGAVTKPGENWKVVVLQKILDRFLGAVPPEKTFFQNPLSWLNWGLKMLGHLTVRIGVISAVDLPVHGSFHHLNPAHRDWPNGIYVRQAEAERGFPGYPERPLEMWGLWNAMDVVFESLSTAPPLN
jgi:fatty acid desaturase